MTKASTKQNTGVSSYKPCRPERSFAERLTWPFSLKGRARRRLCRALGAGNAEKAAAEVAALGKTARRLLAAESHSKAGLETTVEEVVGFLAWEALERSDLAQTAQWLAKLDDARPAMVGRHALRWRLIQSLQKVGDDAGFVAQAKKLACEENTRPEWHKRAVMRLIKVAYERISREACKAIIGAATPAIRESKEAKAAEQLCRVPEVLSSASEAEEWARKLAPKELTLSPVMVADAVTVRAQAFGWAEKWEQMHRLAKVAYEYAPKHGPARYWYLRAGLRIGEADPGALPSPLPEDAPQWRRMASMMKLQGESTLENAEECAAFPGDGTEITALEQDLVAELLRKAVEGQVLDEATVLASWGTVCEEVCKHVPGQAWAALVAARKAARVDEDYGEALRLLKQPGVERLPGAERVARIARLLNGEPAAPHGEVEDVLSAVECAHRWLLVDSRNADEASVAACMAFLERPDEDETVAAYPAVGTLGHVLHLSLRAMWQPDDGALAAFLAHELPEDAQPWARWLWHRAMLSLSNPLDRANALARLDVTTAGVAWAAALWVNEMALRPLDASSRSDALAGALRAELQVRRLKAAPFLRGLLDLPGRGYAGAEALEVPADMKELFPALGDNVNRLLKLELEWIVRFYKARGKIQDSRLSSTRKDLKKLARQSSGNGLLLQGLWRPVFLYWEGVAAAHLGREEAASLLQIVADGRTKAWDARGQLAMLHLRDGELDRASDILQGAPLEAPGLCYASALTAFRRDDLTQARTLLASPALTGPADRSTYTHAARRLEAAVHERKGRLDEAAQGLEAILAVAPNDAVAHARLVRLKALQAYQTVAEGGVAELTGTAAPFKLPYRWVHDYGLLHRLATEPENLLDDEEASAQLRALVKRSHGWCQLAAQRLIASGQAETALAWMRNSAAERTPPLMRAEAILSAWAALREVWATAACPDSSAILDEAARKAAESGQPGQWPAFYEEVARHSWAQAGRQAVSAAAAEKVDAALAGLQTAKHEGQDEELREWEAWLRFALRVYESCVVGESQTSPALPDEVKQGSPLRLAAAAGEEERVQAAQETATAMATYDGRFDGPQRDLLEAWTAHQLGDTDSFLDAYERLEPTVDTLPMNGVDLWLTAAQAWFGRQDWRRITDAALPACVEDLSHPDARLLVSMAYARLAAKNRNQREARQQVETAREILSPLLPEEETEGV